VSDFIIKDSGERQQFASGMQRDTSADKTDYTLIMDGPMFKRWAEHLTAGAKKYAKRNWMQAAGQAELERFVESATRHFFQWVNGDRDEDHGAAVFFNINGAEYVLDKMKEGEALGQAEAQHQTTPRPGEEVGRGGQGGYNHDAILGNTLESQVAQAGQGDVEDVVGSRLDQIRRTEFSDGWDSGYAQGWTDAMTDIKPVVTRE
jgi:hypothetical protein